MKFVVEKTEYDDEALAPVGSGATGDVFLITPHKVAKIFFDDLDLDGVRKLNRLFDLRRSLKLAADGVVALPESAAISVEAPKVVGFSMTGSDKWKKMFHFFLDPSTSTYRSCDGFQFNDESAVRAVFDMFDILNQLSRGHLIIGDISSGNILVDPATGRVIFIDTDDCGFEDWESRSQGTPGFVDPRLLERDLNSLQGFDFDSQSDVYALTVVAYSFLFGFRPFSPVRHTPAKWTEDHFTAHGISNLRLAIEGEACLETHGLRLLDQGDIRHFQKRVAEIGAVKGKSGADGNALIAHFKDVFMEGGRANLVARLSSTDARNGWSQRLRLANTDGMIRDLLGKYPSFLQGVAVQEAPMTLVTTPRKDPKPLVDYLSIRGISMDALVAS